MVNRISNIGASGLDIELTVGKLMQAHRMPLDKLMQKKQILTWQSEGYREMNSKILELRNAAFDMKLEGPYLTKKAVSADETVISATAAPEAVHGTYQLQVLQLATSASLTSTANTGASSSSATLSSIGMTTVPGQTLTIAGEKGSATINLAVGDTIAGFISAVNAKSTSTGVKASYDATLDRFFFASTTTGVNSKVELTSSEPAFVTDVLNLSSGLNNGLNASIKFNGVSGSYASNNFSVNGISFTAKKVQLSDLSIVVSQESDKIYNSIKAFVDKYNEVIDAVNTKISQVKYKDFAPLTDAQKKELSEDDIKLWEDKAKSGLLRNDAILSSSLQTFRNALTKSVSGLPVSNLKSLSELGITTGSYTEKGKLLINETKLRAAISDKPGEVMALFTSTDSVALTDAGDGIATRLYDYSNRMIDVLKNKAGSTTGIEASNLIHKQVIQLNKQMDTFNLKLTTLESRYYRQFTAMEKYITQLSSQSNFLANNYSQQ